MTEVILNKTINRILYLCMSYASADNDRDKQGYAMKAVECAKDLMKEGRREQINELHAILLEAQAHPVQGRDCFNKGWDAALRSIAAKLDALLEHL